MRKMEKTPKGSGGGRSVSPDITTITVASTKKTKKSRIRTSTGAPTTATTTSTPAVQDDLEGTRNENKEFTPETSCSSSSTSMGIETGVDQSTTGVEKNTDQEAQRLSFAETLVVKFPTSKRGRPIKKIDRDDEIKPKSKVKPVTAVKVKTVKNYGKSLKKTSSGVGIDVTDSVIKEEFEEKQEEQTESSPATSSPNLSSPAPSQANSSTQRNILISPDMTSFSGKEVEEKKYDPNFIPGLDLLGKTEGDNSGTTAVSVNKSFFEKVNEKMADCSLVSSADAKSLEPKSEAKDGKETETTSPAKEDDNKIRRSSRIKKLETRRGSARRREVVFSNTSDRDSGFGNLSRTTSLSSMLDDDSNSSGGVSNFSSVSTPSGLNVDAYSHSPPGDGCSLISTTSSNSGGFSSGLSGSSTLKLKSRWRYSLDAESFKSEGSNDNAGSAGYSMDTSEIGTNESPAAPEMKISQTLVSRPGYIVHEKEDVELLEKLEKFEGIEENLFRTERKMSRDRRGMVCDCYLTQEDIYRGEIGCNEDCLNRLLMIECGSRCPVGDRCTNKKFQRKEYCPLEVFKTDKKGHGLRTLQALPENGFVMEYVGEVLDPREFKHRTKEYAKSNHEHFYFMALKSDAIIDATLRGNCSRFINHSCEPNCETQKWTVNGELRIGFFAIRDLEMGEEITFDYQFQRYGKKAQQCFCNTPSCRGWIGGDNDDDQRIDIDRVKGNEADSGRVKTKAEKKRRKDTVLEDMAFEEELAKLEQMGLRNKKHTLTLCRLMVRAEDWDDRERILNILINGDKPCRRLFLDYHGLSLLWGWMLDLPLPTLDSETQAIRTDCYHLLVLKALSTLPILDKSMLQESKVFFVVEKWSSAPPTSKFIVRKVKPEISEATSSDSVADPVPASVSTPEIVTESQVQQEPESTTMTPQPTPTETPPSESDVTVPVVASSSTQPELTPSSSSGDSSEKMDITTSSDEPVAADSTASAVPLPVVIDLEESIEELNWEFVEKAKEVLGSWAGLQDVFRIPKKERVEQMKEHEREADIGDDKDKSNRDDRDRSRSKQSRSKGERIGERYRERDRDRDRERDRDFTIRQQHRDRDRDRSHSHSHLSKEQRRNLFAAEVAREEQEQRNRRMQDEMVSLHQDRCAHLGLDVTTVPIVDPSCTYYLEPTTVTWKAIMLDDPNLAPEIAMIVHSAQYPPQEENPEYMAPEPEFVFPPWPEGLLPPPPLPPAVLPPSWKMSVDDEGRCYYYHVRTRHTQWFPPSPESSGFGSDSSDSGGESVDEIDTDGNSEGTLSSSEQLLLRSQACTKFNASGMSERSERRKKAGLVQERIISPRTEDERPLISQKSIRARKVQLMEQKIREAREAESRGMGLILSHTSITTTTTTELTAGASTTNLSASTDMTATTGDIDAQPLDPSTSTLTSFSLETVMKEEEMNESLTSLSLSQKKPSRRHRSSGGGQVSMEAVSKKLQLLPEVGIGLGLEDSLQSVSLDETGNGDGADSNNGNVLGMGTTTEILPISPVESDVVIPSSSSRIEKKERLAKISERKKSSHKRSSGSGSGSSSGSGKKRERERGSLEESEGTTTAQRESSALAAVLATKLDKKGKGPCVDDFRSQIANVVVQYLNPYRKQSCKSGHIATTEDFKHLARKMTHTIMLKELKHCRAGKSLVVNENVKHKMKEFVKKYMAKYGERSYARSPDDSHSGAHGS